MNSTSQTIDTAILNPEAQNLLEAVRRALAERAMWKAEAERLHRLLREQIAQNGELTRQLKAMQHDEAAPEYVWTEGDIARAKAKAAELKAWLDSFDDEAPQHVTADYPQEEATL